MTAVNRAGRRVDRTRRRWSRNRSQPLTSGWAADRVLVGVIFQPSKESPMSPDYPRTRAAAAANAEYARMSRKTNLLILAIFGLVIA